MSALLRCHKRIIQFVCVGTVCFALQLAILTALVHLGAYRPVANAIGFATSAQLNFLLNSKMTWRDRPAAGLRGTGARWLGYNVSSLGSLASNTAIFAVTYRAIGTVPAAALGVIAGTCLVFAACNLLVFRQAVVR